MSKHRVVLLVLIGVALLARILPQPRTVDDAFITFRYSRNIVEGEGFVYNTGEKILGTTTPLYTGLMALTGAILGDDYPTYALILNALADAGGVVLLFFLALELTQNPLVATWVALLWAVSPFSVTFAIGGMETSVHNLFMLGAWYSYLTKRPRWLGAMCALGVLTRPDALLWAVPILVGQVLTSPPGPFSASREGEKANPRYDFLQTWGIGLVIIAPWLIFATVYFGSPIPQTIGAKDDVYLLEATQAILEFFVLYAVPFQGPVLPGALQAVIGVIGIIIYPFLALVGLRSQPRALPIFIYPWLYAMVFSLANPLIFRWYLVPPLPAYFLAMGCGLYALVALLPETKRTMARNILVGAAILTVAFSLHGWTLRPDHEPDMPAPRMAFHELEMNYEEMAKLLRRKYGVNENTVIAAGDIGAFGFYSRAHIFDTIGLVTEGTGKYYSKALLEEIRAEDFIYAIPPDLILDRQPEYVVVMDLFIREGLLKEPRFLEQYEQLEFMPTDYYGDGMYVFQRKENE